MTQWRASTIAINDLGDDYHRSTGAICRNIFTIQALPAARLALMRFCIRLLIGSVTRLAREPFHPHRREAV